MTEKYLHCFRLETALCTSSRLLKLEQRRRGCGQTESVRPLPFRGLWHAANAGRPLIEWYIRVPQILTFPKAPLHLFLVIGSLLLTEKYNI